METQRTAAKEDAPQAKKSVHRHRPVIRQTLTSMYRMAKANPLLLLDTNKKNELHNLKLPKSVTSFTSINCSHLDIKTGRDVTKPQLANTNLNKKVVEPSKTQMNIKSGSTQVKTKETVKPPPAQIKKNFVLSNREKVLVRNNKQRVSLTSQHKKKQQLKCDATLSKLETTVHHRRSKSAESYRPAQPENISLSVQSIEDLTQRKIEVRRVTFKSPIGYERRSVTFMTPRNNSRVSFYASTPRPTNELDLKKKLDDWLRRRGKSLSSFHHLKCFNVEGDVLEENKENIEAPVDLNKDQSYENLKIENEEEEQKEATPVRDLRMLIKDALQDLLKLIQDGYFQDQCEAWLAKIRQKYHDLDEEPQYWECRAGLEQSKGNITAAVECYRTAIVKGAEVQTVDESLDQLLQKFSLLNISVEEANEESERKARIVLDARNAFKSTIIQFAVQEKKMKKKDEDVKKQFVVVTPVRRSARLSTSARSDGSALKLYSTLKELEGENMTFKNNNFLSRRYAPN